jgi:hypothetical protein
MGKNGKKMGKKNWKKKLEQIFFENFFLKIFRKIILLFFSVLSLTNVTESLPAKIWGVEAGWFGRR